MSTVTTLQLRRPDLEAFFASATSLPAMRHGGAQPLAALSRTDLSAAFTALESRLAERAELCRRTAPDFNVFDFISPSENVLSDILRFFLEPMESHGQGPMFLESMLRLVRPDLSVGCQGATVTREVVTYSIPRNRRLIDVVATHPGFVLAIENKKFTGEGAEQIQDYCQHLENIAKGRPFCLVFLTRSGAEASSITPELSIRYRRDNQLKSWSWERDIPAWLSECDAHCEPAKIRHFLEDFRGYIARYLAIQKDSIEDHDNE